MISVIIPVYNVRPYLGRCLNTLKVQTFRDWEGIVVDDGSTDGSGQMADDLCDSRFTVIHQPNAGLSAARNAGMAAANGDSYFFLDSDDYLERNALDWIDLQARNHPEAGRIVGLDFVHHIAHGYSSVWTITPAGLHAPDSLHLFSGAECDPGHVTACLYVKDKIPEGMAFRKVRLFEDMLFNMELIFAGVSTFIGTKVIYNYIRRDGSLITQYLTDEEAEIIRRAFQTIVEKYKPIQETYDRCHAFLERAIRSRMNKKQ